MIEIQNLSRHFGALKAVDEISFSVSSGTITGFLGPNGAGKTTTMRMMVGYLQPSAGSILLDGKSIFADPIATSTKIGYLPELNPLYDEMFTQEILRYIADLRKMPATLFAQRLEYVVEKCGLQDVLTQRVGTLSKGYRQRVGLAMAILHDPEILILDEPTSGLDPNQILEIRELIRTLGTQKTVLLSSHIMQEVQALCDRVLIINKGKIIVDDEIGKLSSYFKDHQILHLELEAEDADFGEFMEYHPDLQIISQTQEGDNFKMQIKMPADLDIKYDLARFIAENGWLIVSLYTQEKSLEEIFYNLTKEGGQLPKPAFEEKDLEDAEELPSAVDTAEDEGEEEL
ncbi:MAG: ATP-binding cassette domain-containing protein [Candidatus Cloacimonetes bacterium]|jgi:ABC-2 type transport system ATP-binding protein|nr:ATP-binding cassette domain-containing protein [Candidatus Cloacimonadota bacterium]MCK9184330.1 ATP-binding cassette domain-containing protein [Candidatus Cloacimonadota bacterium]MCK9583817.1 ATP-binding cassette domain-containing protein [Candidatus Cloacimonadota bacterium]